VMARSYAPRVGVRMPSSGERPSASAPGLLASAYAFTASMKPCPASTPTISSSSHSDRAASSSAISLRARSRERKEDLLQIAAQLGQRSFGDGASVVEQEEAVADARGVGELVDGEDERASPRGVAPQHLGR